MDKLLGNATEQNQLKKKRSLRSPVADGCSPWTPATCLAEPRAGGARQGPAWGLTLTPRLLRAGSWGRFLCSRRGREEGELLCVRLQGPPVCLPSSPGAMVLPLEDKGRRTDTPTRRRAGRALSRVRHVRSCSCGCWTAAPLLQHWPVRHWPGAEDVSGGTGVRSRGRMFRSCLSSL